MFLAAFVIASLRGVRSSPALARLDDLPRGRNSLGDMSRTEVSLRQQAIVRRAKQAKIIRSGDAASRPRLLMMNLQKSAS